MKRRRQSSEFARVFLGYALLSLVPALAQGQASSGLDLVETLRGGGLVIAMRQALRELDVRVGAIWSSPTFRAIETAQYLELGEAETFAELDSRGRDSAWLLDQVAVAPPPGTNTIIVTHAPNLGDAFGDEAAGMSDGEALVLRPDGSGAAVIARVPIEDWPALAAER